MHLCVRLAGRPGGYQFQARVDPLLQLGLTHRKGQSVLRRWVEQERGGVLEMRPNRPIRSEAAGEVERLQRDLRRVIMERDILKKALGYKA
jgi:transposase